MQYGRSRRLDSCPSRLGCPVLDYTNSRSQGTVFVSGDIQSACCGVFTYSKAPQGLPTRSIQDNGRMSTLHPDSELMDLLDRIAAQDDSCLLYTSDAADE